MTIATLDFVIDKDTNLTSYLVGMYTGRGGVSLRKEERVPECSGILMKLYLYPEGFCPILDVEEWGECEAGIWSGPPIYSKLRLR